LTRNKFRQNIERERANSSNFHWTDATMRLTFLGKETQGGGSPTLFLTDQNSYVVQGWKVAGEDPATVVEIPAPLLRHLQPGTDLGAALSDTGRSWTDDNGRIWNTFVLTGTAVTDQATLSQMDIPSHESCIEVGRLRRDEG
jgi:hypothetical protein